MFVENFTLEFFMNVRIATCMLKPSTLIYMRVTPDCALNYRLIENIFYHWINQKCKKKIPILWIGRISNDITMNYLIDPLFLNAIFLISTCKQI